VAVRPTKHLATHVDPVYPANAKAAPVQGPAGYPVTCVDLRLAVQVRRAIPSIRPFEPQDVSHAEYTED
jgi:hypothetical protein